MRRDIVSRTPHPDQRWEENGYLVTLLFVGKDSDISYNVRCKRCSMGIHSFARASKKISLIREQAYIYHPCKYLDEPLAGFIVLLEDDIRYVKT